MTDGDQNQNQTDKGQVDNTDQSGSEEAQTPPAAGDQKPTEETPVGTQAEEAAPSPVIATPSEQSESREKQSETGEEIASSPAPRNDDEDKPASDSETEKSAPAEEEKEAAPTPVAPQKDVKGARWYVVHTYSGHEAKVAATLKQRVESQKLQDKVLDILVPTQEKIEIKEGKKNKIKEKIFPGYLLIRMLLDDNTWLVVRTTPGITSFVGMGNRPTPLPDEEVASIQRFMSMEAPKFKTTFSAGEAVKIVDGPFSEFLGSISEIDEEKGKLKVLVSIFGRETPVELDFLQVAKL